MLKLAVLFLLLLILLAGCELFRRRVVSQRDLFARRFWLPWAVFFFLLFTSINWISLDSAMGGDFEDYGAIQLAGIITVLCWLTTVIASLLRLWWLVLFGAVNILFLNAVPTQPLVWFVVFCFTLVGAVLKTKLEAEKKADSLRQKNRT